MEDLYDAEELQGAQQVQMPWQGKHGKVRCWNAVMVDTEVSRQGLTATEKPQQRGKSERHKETEEGYWLVQMM